MLGPVEVEKLSHDDSVVPVLSFPSRGLGSKESKPSVGFGVATIAEYDDLVFGVRSVVTLQLSPPATDGALVLVSNTGHALHGNSPHTSLGNSNLVGYHFGAMAVVSEFANCVGIDR